jgi:hypothetical protein
LGFGGGGVLVDEDVHFCSPRAWAFMLRFDDLSRAMTIDTQILIPAILQLSCPKPID